MHFFATFAPFFVLVNSLNVVAHPTVIRDSPISMPFTRYIGASDASDLVRRDRERARTLLNRGSILTTEMDPDVGVTNAGIYYVASVGVGNPATYCRSC
jgi:hypothetical protein